MAIKKEGVHPKEKTSSAPSTPRGADLNAKEKAGESNENGNLTPSVKPVPNYLRPTISFSNHTNFHYLKKHQHASESPSASSTPKERSATLAKQTISSELLSSEKARKTHARTRSLPNIDMRRREATVSSPTTASAKMVGSPKVTVLEKKEHKLSPLSRQVKGSSNCTEGRKMKKVRERKEVEDEKEKAEQEKPNESTDKMVAKMSKVKALVGRFETVVSMQELEEDQPVEEMKVEEDEKPKEEEKEVVKEEIKDGELGKKCQQEVEEIHLGVQGGQHDQKEEEGKGGEGAEMVVVEEEELEEGKGGEGDEMVVVVEEEEEEEQCKEAKELTESGEKDAGEEVA